MAEVESVAVGHIGAHGLLERVFRAPEVERVESVDSGGVHPDHEEVLVAVAVKICECVGHAEGVGIGYELAGLVCEGGVTGIQVEIQSGEVTDDEEVEEVVVIEVNEGGGVGAAVSFGGQA